MLELMMVVITFYLMLLVGLELEVKALTQEVRSFYSVGVGVLAQLTLLPALALLIIKVIMLPVEISIGILLVALCPGGAVSNYYSLLARGDIAYSVTLTIITTFASSLSLPILFNLLGDTFINYPGSVRLPIFYTLVQLTSLLIIPVLTGVIIRKKFYSLTVHMLPLAKLTGSLGLILVTIYIYFSKIEHMEYYFSYITQSTIYFTLGALFIGYASGRIFKLSERKLIALAIEFPSRNLAIASTIILTLLENDDFIIFSIAIFMIQLPLFILFIMLSILRRKIDDSDL